MTKHWVPIWVVRVDEQVYVRTWHRRDNGWFGQVLESLRARIRVPGLEVDVAIEDIGEDKTELRASIDAAYRVKYGHYGGTSVDRMVTDDAAASTLGFIAEQGHGPVVGGFRSPRVGANAGLILVTTVPPRAECPGRCHRAVWVTGPARTSD